MLGIVLDNSNSHWIGGRSIGLGLLRLWIVSVVERFDEQIKFEAWFPVVIAGAQRPNFGDLSKRSFGGLEYLFAKQFGSHWRFRAWRSRAEYLERGESVIGIASPQFEVD